MAEIDTPVASGNGEVRPAWTGAGITRRDVLVATSLAIPSLAVAGVSLPRGAIEALASASPKVLAVPLAGREAMPVPETPEARATRLGFELAEALDDLGAPVRFATIYPTQIHSQPVLIADLQDVIEATSTVSQDLMAAMCDHAAAMNALLHACLATDAIARGHEPSKADFLRLSEAEEHEYVTLMTLCRHPVRNEPERQEKANYLLDLSKTTELKAETVEAILVAMAAPITGTDAVVMPAVFMRRPLRDGTGARSDELRNRPDDQDRVETRERADQLS